MVRLFLITAAFVAGIHPRVLDVMGFQAAMLCKSVLLLFETQLCNSSPGLTRAKFAEAQMILVLSFSS